MDRDILPIPSKENERLLSVFQYGVLDTIKEDQLDALTETIASIFQVPITLITILDDKRQWFKSNYGLTIKETERSISFCQYTIMTDELFEIPDAAEDEKFKHNPLVTGHPYIRYYCGAPLKNEHGYTLGSLAIIDRVPRTLDDHQKKTLRLLALTVVNHFELNLKRKQLQLQKDTLEQKVAERTRELEQRLNELKNRDEVIVAINNDLSRLIYKASHDLLGPIKTIQGLITLGLTEEDIATLHRYFSLIGSITKKLDQALINLVKVIAIKDPTGFNTVIWEFLIDHALNKAKKRVDGKSFKITTEISTNGNFQSDTTILEIILEELFVNSMQYNTHPEVVIATRVFETEKELCIHIKDNGIGIREDEKGRIFDMFFKNSKSRGSGLGLYVVKSAVEKLNGTIQAESKTNAGTNILITFPMRRAETIQ